MIFFYHFFKVIPEFLGFQEFPSFSQCYKNLVSYILHL